MKIENVFTEKKCHLALTNNLDLHSFPLIIESGSLSYWIQHTKLCIWGKSHALIIFWKLPLILAAKQLNYYAMFSACSTAIRLHVFRY